MCGRFLLVSKDDLLRRAFELDAEDEIRIPPRYNIAPTQEALVIRIEAGARRPVGLRWGLVPAWAKDAGGGARMINARSETAAEKPSFRAAMRARRCLVPADGFYEWVRTPDGKVPMHIRLDGEGPFAFAGLYERWEKGESPVETFTILTTDANQALKDIHPRMPVILHPKDYDLWLDPAVRDPEAVASLMAPFPSGRVRATPANPKVGNVRNDGPELLEVPRDDG